MMSRHQGSRFKYMAAAAAFGTAVMLASPAAAVLPSDAGDVTDRSAKRAASSCGVSTPTPRMGSNLIEYGGEVTCYGIGNLKGTVWLQKWSVDRGGYVTVAQGSGSTFGSKLNLWRASKACPSTATREYYAILSGEFLSSSGGSSGTFREISATVDLPCNIPAL